MAFVYIAVMLIVPVLWFLWAGQSMNKPSKRYEELQTAAAQVAGTSTPLATIPVNDRGDFIVYSPTPKPVGSVEPAVVAASVPQMIYVVVTATLTPIPSPTPNPYGTLHLTLTQLFRAFTASPQYTPMWMKPQYLMGSNQCFRNCGFVTSTPTWERHQ